MHLPAIVRYIAQCSGAYHIFTSTWGFRRCSFQLTGQCESLSIVKRAPDGSAFFLYIYIHKQLLSQTNQTGAFGFIFYTMKKKDLLFFTFLFLLTGLFVSCGDDDDNDDGNGGVPPTEQGNTEIKTDYTATYQVKTATIKGINDTYFNNVGITIYEDFNTKYSLAYESGILYLLPYERVGGAFNLKLRTNYYGHPIEGGWYSDKVSAKDMGKVSGLSSVTTKLKESVYYPKLQPYHGYAMYFTTEDGEVKYLRVYCSGYTLDNFGQLNTITLMYQLY